MYASEWGKKEIVETLLQHKNTEINKQCRYGRTALILASEVGKTEIVEI
jgi:ankyrin repeat protein